MRTLTHVEREIERRAIEKAREAQEKEGALSFRTYAKMAWPILEPGTRLVDTWSFGAICEFLQAITEGEIQHGLINIPPGMSKSMLCSVLWQTWEWGPRNMPWLRYLSTSYSEDYAKRDTRKSRDLMLSDWYQSLWDNFTLTRTGEKSFANDHRGDREAKPFVSLTGGRGDRLIIDDAHSTEQAESEADRERAVRIARESVPSRLNDQESSSILAIMQRLHQKDVSATLLASDLGFVHLNLPMRYEDDRKCIIKIGSKTLFKDPRKREGELLAPERFTEKRVDALEAALGAYAFNAQYQQRPGSRAGIMFRREWFEIVDAAPVDGCVDCRAWDLAGTKVDARKSPDPDWTVGIRMRRTPEGLYYIIGETRLRQDGLIVARTIKNTAIQDGMDVKVRLPKDPAQAGKDQARRLVGMLAGWQVRAVAETGDKATRAQPFADQCEAGNVRIVAGAWVDAFLDELCSFPASGHDDRVDACSSAFNELALPNFNGDIAGALGVPLNGSD